MIDQLMREKVRDLSFINLEFHFERLIISKYWKSFEVFPIWKFKPLRSILNRPKMTIRPAGHTPAVRSHFYRKPIKLKTQNFVRGVDRLKHCGDKIRWWLTHNWKQLIGTEPSSSICFYYILINFDQFWSVLVKNHILIENWWILTCCEFNFPEFKFNFGRF